MKVVLMCDNLDASSRRMCDQLNQRLRAFDPQVYRRIDGLINGLKDLIGETVVCALIVSSRSMLADLLEQRDLLGEPVFVLILPDQQAATIKLAHRLSPHFVGFLEDDPGLFESVIEKIVGRSDDTGSARRH